MAATARCAAPRGCHLCGSTPQRRPWSRCPHIGTV